MAGFMLRIIRWRIDACGPRLRVAVALTDDAVGRIHEVAAACRARGFEHDATLRSVGVLTGSAAVEHLARLRRVPGVLAVEIERGGIRARDHAVRKGAGDANAARRPSGRDFAG